MGGFFVDDCCFGQQLGEFFSENCFVCSVGDSDDIIDCFGGDLILCQGVVVWQDGLFGCFVYCGVD